jgi:hypothetical protein
MLAGQAQESMIARLLHAISGPSRTSDHLMMLWQYLGSLHGICKFDMSMSNSPNIIKIMQLPRPFRRKSWSGSPLVLQPQSGGMPAIPRTTILEVIKHVENSLQEDVAIDQQHGQRPDDLLSTYCPVST